MVNLEALGRMITIFYKSLPRHTTPTWQKYIRFVIKHIIVNDYYIQI